VDEDAPGVEGLSENLRKLAERISLALQKAKRPLIISGCGCRSMPVIHAAANIARALCKDGRSAELCFTVPECNSLGLALMGGKSIGDAFTAVRRGEADAVIILENDLYRRADPAVLDEVLESAGHVVVIDHTSSATTAKAEAVLPCGTFAETEGSMINNEGRAQRYFKVLVPDGEIQESWRWLRDIMVAAGRHDAERWGGLDDIVAELVGELPEFVKLPEVAPPEGFRVKGLKIPRQPHRYSGRTAMEANINVHEPGPPEDPDSALAFSMEGYEGQPPPPLIARFWAPGWNSVQAVNKFQSEVGGPLRGGDPGRRVIEPSGETPYFRDVPDAFRFRAGEILVIPLYHLFGSEELSILSSWIAELAPKPYLALSPEFASSMRMKEGDEAALSVENNTYTLPVKYIASLPEGVAGIPSGMPGLEGIDLPAAGKVSLLRSAEEGEGS
jgi:NADH-quinone oxidoreductase subunit G